ncbi:MULTISPECIES: flagellar hook-basal body complex protein FliE [Pseudoalteromonas]|uniref:Flagellar hook-basal body complex protein FliE n=2 Tax=Pseudoalteromonas TaxID=53246 RepID=A0A4Q7EC27_9GAMM|nr:MULTISPECIES: flagellar hook-basal body complex protein FliE [Pseudoalteromonas]QTL34241.1 flagellar hook-basal body complex protein FliE [Pseudoalteromonas viridis]RZM80283.1 flagellar hook-basal body complex protein FliE [Pseudoalteromonas rubra]
MKIQSTGLYQEMQAMASEATRVKPQDPNKLPVQVTAATSSAQFGDLLSDALNTVAGLQRDAKEKVTAVEMGDRSVSLAEAMIARNKASVAFDATMNVRNKLVEAYKDIMSMPV